MGNWNPVAERVPEENGRYLVTYREKSVGGYVPFYDSTYLRIMRYHNGEWKYPVNLNQKMEEDLEKEVLAWMDLPEVYEV